MESKIIKISKRVHLPTWIALGVVVVLFPIIFLALYNPKGAEAEWLSERWLYRKKITFGNTGAAVTNQKVKFDIDTAALIPETMQSACQDSRFTDVTGKVLRYFLDTSGGACDTSSTDYYVLMPNIGVGTQVIYFYYGNPSASATTVAANFSEATFTPTSGPTIGGEEKGAHPVSWWNLDEGVDNTCSGGVNDACDAIGNNNDGAITGGAAWKNEEYCIAGKCLFFDGTDDVVTVTNTASIDFDTGLLTAVTFDAWVKVNSDGEGSVGEIFQKGTNTYMRITNDGTDGFSDLEAKLDLGTTDATATITNGITLNKWHHVAMGYTDDGDDEISVYIDGILRATSTDGVGNPAPTDTNNLLIGGSSAANFHGTIDDFRVFNFERTLAQVRTTAQIQAAPRGSQAVLGVSDNAFLGSGLGGYWALEEAATPGLDSSGNGNSGTWTGNVAQTSGKFGYGATFDGTGDYISVADAVSLSPTAGVTISSWVNPNSSIATKAIVVKDGSYRLVTDASGNPQCQVHNGTSWQTAATSSVALSLSAWQQVACTFNGKDEKIYVNGTLSGNSAISVSIADTANAVRIGSDAGATFGDYNGKQDSVRIFSRALEGFEIQSLYAWAPSPVAHWKLDEKTGTNAFDSSTNANNGTITVGSGKFEVGKFGQSFKFDNASSVVGAGSGASLDNLPAGAGMSLSAWIYPISQGESSAGVIIAKNVGTTPSAGWLFQFAGTNALTFTVDGSTDLVRTTSNSVVTANSWNHVEVAWDGVITTAASVRIYVNGSEVTYATTTDGAARVDDGTSTFFVGNDSTSARTFDGRIDDARVYNYQRTPGQVISDLNGFHPLGGSPIASQVVSYGFDEQYGAVTNNSNPLNATLTGTITGSTWTTKASCKVSGCLDFDGTDDNVAVTNASQIDLNEGLVSGFTIGGWIFPDTAGEGDGGRIFTKNTNTWLRVDTLSGGFLDIEASLDLATADATVNATVKITQSAWNHVALTWTDDADDEITIWVNGQPVATSTDGDGAPAADAANLTIGNETGATTQTFDGKIDEFQIYSAELTPAEMKIFYNHGGAVNYSVGVDDATQVTGGAGNAPIIYYTFDEKTGTSINDISGNGETGTMNNFTASSWTPGRYGSSLDFDGSSTYITSSPTLPTTDFTLEAWIKTTTLNGVIFYAGQAGGVAGTELSMTVGVNASAGELGLDLNNQVIASSLGTVNTGKWTHVAITRLSTIISFYVNGYRTRTAVNGTALNFGTCFLMLGADATLTGSNCTDGRGDWFDGLIDDLRIYDYARTPAQVVYDWNHGGPFQYYNLDECTGATAYDSIDVGFDIKIQDGASITTHGTVNPGASGNTTVGACNNDVSTSMRNNGTTGKRNSALDFDGTNDNVSLQNPDVSSPSLLEFLSSIYDFSAFAWVKRDTTGNMEFVFSVLDGTTADVANDGWSMYFTTGNVFRCQYEALNADTLTVITDANWHHVGCTYDRDGNMQAYLDGKPDGTAVAISGDQTMALGNNFYRIGARSHNVASTVQNPFNGLIDDVAIYTYPLSATQIRRLYGAEFGGARFGPDTGSP